jgi:3-isopropylmalate dehydrogenase
MLRFSFQNEAAAQAIENAVSLTLKQGLRTKDILTPDPSGKTQAVTTVQMTDGILAHLMKLSPVLS